MIDYMHPMVLLNEQILSDINEKGRLDRDIRENEEKLKVLFEDTLLYKELKEKYLSIKLTYFDEEETCVDVVDFELNEEMLTFYTQEIEDQLEIRIL